MTNSEYADSPFGTIGAAVAAQPGTILAAHPDRDITLVWHDASPDPLDHHFRESGYETHLLTALTPDGTCVGYLRLSFTTPHIIAARFPRLLAWANENMGWCLGFDSSLPDGSGQPPPAQLWRDAHRYANATPASLAAAGTWVPSYLLTDAHVPTDPAVLEADLAAIEKRLAKDYQHWLTTHTEPTVAYSHVAEHLRGTGLGRLLYLTAAQHLGQDGRVLCASGSQTAKARALWARLVADPTVPAGTHTIESRTGNVRTSHTLDYRPDPTQPTGPVPADRRTTKTLGWAAYRRPRVRKPTPATVS